MYSRGISFHFISSHFMSPFSFSVKFSTSDIITFLLFPTVVVLHHPFIMISPASSLSHSSTPLYGDNIQWKCHPLKSTFGCQKIFKKIQFIWRTFIIFFRFLKLECVWISIKISTITSMRPYILDKKLKFKPFYIQIKHLQNTIFKKITGYTIISSFTYYLFIFFSFFF